MKKDMKIIASILCVISLVLFGIFFFLVAIFITQNIKDIHFLQMFFVGLLFVIGIYVIDKWDRKMEKVILDGR